MAYRIALPFAAALVFTACAGGNALADQASASACATKLNASAKKIYDASAPKAGSGDLRSVVTDATRGLVMSGEIDRDSARPNAEAAGKCLMMLGS